jgi:cell division protein FtsN
MGSNACSLAGRASPFPQQTEEQRKQNADEQACGQREIQFEMLAVDADITRQPAEPRQLATQPEQSSERDQHEPNEDQDFADVVHENHHADTYDHDGA